MEFRQTTAITAEPDAMIAHLLYILLVMVLKKLKTPLKSEKIFSIFKPLISNQCFFVLVAIIFTNPILSIESLFFVKNVFRNIFVTFFISIISKHVLKYT